MAYTFALVPYNYCINDEQMQRLLLNATELSPKVNTWRGGNLTRKDQQEGEEKNEAIKIKDCQRKIVPRAINIFLSWGETLDAQDFWVTLTERGSTEEPKDE